MRNIVYYVALSIDGFICGPAGDITGFVEKSDGIDKYFDDLKGFDTVIMGKNTYEFGYKYGLAPGQLAYPHMTHYIFSDSLHPIAIGFENPHPNLHIKKRELTEIEKLKRGKGTDIYLCGGGLFAGWLLDNQQIDILKIKLNPLVLGSGVQLFGDSTKRCNLELIDRNEYENGLLIITYKIIY